MFEQLEASLPYLPATLGLLVLLLLSPLCEEIGRRRIALVFALGAAGMILLAVRRADTPNTLKVVNAFPIGPEMRSTPILIETVIASGWQWPALVAATLGALALLTFGSLRLPARAPSPAGRCLLVGTLFVALRLLLEKNAAPAGLVWAVGGSIGLPILVGFCGWYAGARERGFGSLLQSLLLLAALQRAIISGFSYLATTRHWGTHLDVGALTELNTPLGGARRFGSDLVEKWTWAVLVPQMALWVGVTVVLGVVVGGVAWGIARRR